MESLRQTTVIPLLPAARVGGGLLRWLHQREFIVRVLAGALFLSLLLNVVITAALMRQIQRRIQFVALVQGKSFTGEGESLKEAAELHEQTARLATAVLLTRNSEGFDLGEFLPRLFARDTQTLAGQLRQQEQADFTQRRLQQTATVTRVEARASRRSGLEMWVTGQLVRKGQFGGKPVEESVPFTLQLTCTPNPDLRRADRYPLLVSAFTLTYDPPQP